MNGKTVELSTVGEVGMSENFDIGLVYRDADDEVMIGNLGLLTFGQVFMGCLKLKQEDVVSMSFTNVMLKEAQERSSRRMCRESTSNEPL